MANIDIKAIYATYLNAYESGHDVQRAKRYALETHNVPEKDLARVAALISGSCNWGPISEINVGARSQKRTLHRHKKQTAPEFTLPQKDTLSTRLAECELLAREANEDVCPLPD